MNRKHFVREHKLWLTNCGYFETKVVMESGRDYRFRITKKVHLMFHYGRTSDHPQEYKVARAFATRVLDKAKWDAAQKTAQGEV